MNNDDDDDEEPSELELAYYIEAAEMYLEALKLERLEGTVEPLFTKALYFGKASLAFIDSGNREATLRSLRDSLKVYAEVIRYCDSRKIENNFYYTCKLIVDAIRKELK